MLDTDFHELSRILYGKLQTEKKTNQKQAEEMSQNNTQIEVLTSRIRSLLNDRLELKSLNEKLLREKDETADLALRLQKVLQEKREVCHELASVKRQNRKLQEISKDVTIESQDNSSACVTELPKFEHWI